MTLSLGRGLAPLSSPLPTVQVFKLTAALSPLFTYTRNDTVATCRNASGKLAQMVANAVRFDHDAAGNPLGVLCEGSRQNKCTLHNANPTVTTGVSAASGSPTITVAADLAALQAAGLDGVCTGNVFKIEAGGSDCDVDFAGATGNTNAHSFSLWARCTAGSASLQRSGTGGGTTAIAGTAYARYRLENVTPSGSSVTLRVHVPAGGVVYCILPQVEEAAFCSSEIVTAGAAATRAATSLAVSSLNAKSWFSPNDGFMVARYRPYVTAVGASQFIVACHSGNTNNTIGCRLHTSDADLQGWIRRDAGTTIHSASTDRAVMRGILHAAGLSWTANEAVLVGNGAYNLTTWAGANPSGITELNAGHRNGAAEMLWGHITEIAVGCGYKTPGGLGARMYKSGDIAIAGGGQSLIGNHFNSTESSSAGGHDKVIAVIGAARPYNAPAYVNGATSSSAASKTSDASNYWWDLAGPTRGPAFDTFYQKVEQAGIVPQIVLWGQGELDSAFIPGITTRAQYKQALLAIFSDMRASFPGVQILIQGIGRRTSFSNTGGIQAVREVQHELADEYDWIHMAAETYDQALFDQVHLTDAGYVAVAERHARKILSVMGETLTGVDGPRVTNASRSGATVTVTIAHDAGTDFTPSSSIEGFRFFDDASEITITAAVRTNATTVTLTLNSTPAGAVRTLYYGYDAMLGLDTADVVKDNAAISLPLRPGKWIVT